MHALVDELLAQAGLVDRLRAEHVPDSQGRCKGCTTGGTGTLAAKWPCTISGLASMAAQRVAEAMS